MSSGDAGHVSGALFSGEECVDSTDAKGCFAGDALAPWTELLLGGVGEAAIFVESALPAAIAAATAAISAAALPPPPVLGEPAGDPMEAELMATVSFDGGVEKAVAEGARDLAAACERGEMMAEPPLPAGCLEC